MHILDVLFSSELLLRKTAHSCYAFPSLFLPICKALLLLPLNGL